MFISTPCISVLYLSVLQFPKYAFAHQFPHVPSSVPISPIYAAYQFSCSVRGSSTYQSCRVPCKILLISSHVSQVLLLISPAVSHIILLISSPVSQVLLLISSAVSHIILLIISPVPKVLLLISPAVSHIKLFISFPCPRFCTCTVLIISLNSSRSFVL
jgi:hypothetical protein